MRQDAGYYTRDSDDATCWYEGDLRGDLVLGAANDQLVVRKARLSFMEPN